MQIRILHHSQELRNIPISSDDSDDSYCENKEILLNYEAVLVLTNLLTNSEHFKRLFVEHHNSHQLDIVFNDPILALIDYKSCDITFQSVWQQVELEDALHWLSTLGGAYSNLGDHSIEFAIKAGKNAYKQMAIALRSQDPLVIYKCWLFVAMSLMQQKQLKKSRMIIQTVHQNVKSIH